MAGLTKLEAKSLKEYLGIIDDIVTDPLDPVWFRGVGDEKYELKPTLFRHPIKSGRDDFENLEKNILNRFKERAIPYLPSQNMRNWEYLFLMQHFGIPTRLLDWTENPLFALFFALTTAKKTKTTDRYAKSAAIWVLSPKLWNAKVFKRVSYNKSALSISDDLLNPYEPLFNTKSFLPIEPAAIYGLHNNTRIVAQRGVFTIFGWDTTPMEKLFQKQQFDKDALKKIVIPKEYIEKLLNKLIATGHTDSMMFPSLEGLAKETKRLYGFEG